MSTVILSEVTTMALAFGGLNLGLAIRDALAYMKAREAHEAAVEGHENALAAESREC